MHHDIWRIPDFQPTCFDRNEETTLIKILDQRNAVAKGTFTFTLSRKVPHQRGKAAKKQVTNKHLWPVNFLCGVLRMVIIDEVLFCSLVYANHTLKNSQRLPKRTTFWCDNTWHNHDFAEYIFYKQRLQTKYSINKYCKASFFSGTCNLRVSITSPKLSPSGLSLKQLIRPVTNDTLQLLLHEILLLQVVFFSMMRRWRDVSFMLFDFCGWWCLSWMYCWDRLTLSCSYDPNNMLLITAWCRCNAFEYWGYSHPVGGCFNPSGINSSNRTSHLP